MVSNLTCMMQLITWWLQNKRPESVSRPVSCGFWLTELKYNRWKKNTCSVSTNVAICWNNCSSNHSITKQPKLTNQNTTTPPKQICVPCKNQWIALTRFLSEPLLLHVTLNSQNPRKDRWLNGLGSNLGKNILYLYMLLPLTLCTDHQVFYDMHSSLGAVMINVPLYPGRCYFQNWIC